MEQERADLYFGRTHAPCGFTSGVVAQFDGSAEPSGETPRALVLAALDLLQLLGADDAAGMVADSPVVASAPPSMRAAVGARLDRSRPYGHRSGEDMASRLSALGEGTSVRGQPRRKR